MNDNDITNNLITSANDELNTIHQMFNPSDIMEFNHLFNIETEKVPLTRFTDGSRTFADKVAEQATANAVMHNVSGKILWNSAIKLGIKGIDDVVKIVDPETGKLTADFSIKEFFDQNQESIEAGPTGNDIMRSYYSGVYDGLTPSRLLATIGSDIEKGKLNQILQQRDGAAGLIGAFGGLGLDPLALYIGSGMVNGTLAHTKDLAYLGKASRYIAEGKGFIPSTLRSAAIGEGFTVAQIEGVALLDGQLKPDDFIAQLEETTISNILFAAGLGAIGRGAGKLFKIKDPTSTILNKNVYDDINRANSRYVDNVAEGVDVHVKATNEFAVIDREPVIIKDVVKRDPSIPHETLESVNIKRDGDVPSSPLDDFDITPEKGLTQNEVNLRVKEINSEIEKIKSNTENLEAPTVEALVELGLELGDTVNTAFGLQEVVRIDANNLGFKNPFSGKIDTLKDGAKHVTKIYKGKVDDPKAAGIDTRKVLKDSSLTDIKILRAEQKDLSSGKRTIVEDSTPREQVQSFVKDKKEKAIVAKQKELINEFREKANGVDKENLGFAEAIDNVINDFDIDSPKADYEIIIQSLRNDIQEKIDLNKDLSPINRMSPKIESISRRMKLQIDRLSSRLKDERSHINESTNDLGQNVAELKRKETNRIEKIDKGLKSFIEGHKFPEDGGPVVFPRDGFEILENIRGDLLSSKDVKSTTNIILKGIDKLKELEASGIDPEFQINVQQAIKELTRKITREDLIHAKSVELREAADIANTLEEIGNRQQEVLRTAKETAENKVIIDDAVTDTPNTIDGDAITVKESQIKQDNTADNATSDNVATDGPITKDNGSGDGNKPPQKTSVSDDSPTITDESMFFPDFSRDTFRKAYNKIKKAVGAQEKPSGAVGLATGTTNLILKTGLQFEYSSNPISRGLHSVTAEPLVTSVAKKTGQWQGRTPVERIIQDNKIVGDSKAGIVDDYFMGFLANVDGLNNTTKLIKNIEGAVKKTSKGSVISYATMNGEMKNLYIAYLDSLEQFRVTLEKINRDSLIAPESVIQENAGLLHSVYNSLASKIESITGERPDAAAIVQILGNQADRLAKTEIFRKGGPQSETEAVIRVLNENTTKIIVNTDVRVGGKASQIELMELLEGVVAPMLKMEGRFSLERTLQAYNKLSGKNIQAIDVMNSSHYGRRDIIESIRSYIHNNMKGIVPSDTFVSNLDTVVGNRGLTIRDLITYDMKGMMKNSHNIQTRFTAAESYIDFIKALRSIDKAKPGAESPNIAIYDSLIKRFDETEALVIKRDNGMKSTETAVVGKDGTIISQSEKVNTIDVAEIKSMTGSLDKLLDDTLAVIEMRSKEQIANTPELNKRTGGFSHINQAENQTTFIKRKLGLINQNSERTQFGNVLLDGTRALLLGKVGFTMAIDSAKAGQRSMAVSFSSRMSALNKSLNGEIARASEAGVDMGYVMNRITVFKEQNKDFIGRKMDTNALEINDTFGGSKTDAVMGNLNNLIFKLSLGDTVNQHTRRFSFFVTKDLLLSETKGMIPRTNKAIQLISEGMSETEALAKAGISKQRYSDYTRIRGTLSDNDISVITKAIEAKSTDKIGKMEDGIQLLDEQSSNELFSMPKPKTDAEAKSFDRLANLMNYYVEKDFGNMPGFTEDFVGSHTDENATISRIGAMFYKATGAQSNRSFAVTNNDPMASRIFTGIYIASVTFVLNKLRADISGRGDQWDEDLKNKPMKVALDAVSYAGLLGVVGDRLVGPAYDLASGNNQDLGRDIAFSASTPVQSVIVGTVFPGISGITKQLTGREPTEAERRSAIRLMSLGIANTTVANAIRFAVQDTDVFDNTKLEDLINFLYPDLEHTDIKINQFQ